MESSIADSQRGSERVYNIVKDMKYNCQIIIKIFIANACAKKI